MENSRIVNTIKNQISQTALMLLATVVPFCMRMVMINTIGAEYTGLNSVFLSIYSVLNMSDLGISSVVVFFLYEPVARGNKEKVNAYLAFLRKFYYVVAVVVTCLSALLLPFLTKIIGTDMPEDCNIYVLFVLFMIPAILGYVLFPEIASLFTAFQRNDINNYCMIAAYVIGYTLQFVSLIVYRSYLAYVSIIIGQTLIIIVLRLFIKNKYFKSYKSTGDLDKQDVNEIIEKVKSMIGHLLDEKLINTVDNLFISSIIGLSAVAAYGNYAMVSSAVTMLVMTTIDAALPSIGNALVTETVESNYNRFKCILWLNACLVGWATACMICLYQGFISLWAPDLMLGMDTVVLFCICFYISGMRKSILLFKNAAGMWQIDKFKPYVAVIVDLLIDLILIRIIGIQGAIIATIVAVGIIETPWETSALYKNLFNKPVRDYYVQGAVYGVVNILVILLSGFVCTKVYMKTGIISLFVKMLICSAISTLVFWCTYRNRYVYKTWREEILRLLKGHNA